MRLHAHPYGCPNTGATCAQDLDALTHQLSAAQSEAAAGGARVAELEAELKGSEREVRALTKARDMMEVDLKAVLGRHAREVRRTNNCKIYRIF